ncbi:MAG: arginase [Clostridiaceae bacterium]|nr:arginase [Clostridiaceae bacterium]
MKYKFFGLPMHYGADSIGLNFGIDELKKELKKKNHDIIEKIDVVNAEEDFDEKYIKYINSITANCISLAKKVNEAVVNNYIPVSIGGDHSISMGSISGVAKEMDIGVIWVDAHGDMNTHETTVTGNIHGMPLAALQGYGHEKLVNIFYKGPKIKTQNVVIFGARNFDYREKLFIEQLGVKVFYHKDILNNGFTRELEKAVNYLTSKINKIHLSFDLDVINPDLLPGVSNPVEDGITLEQADYIFDFFIKSNLLSSVDIVEYNPAFDKNHVTRDFTVRLIEKFM